MSCRVLVGKSAFSVMRNTKTRNSGRHVCYCAVSMYGLLRRPNQANIFKRTVDSIYSTLRTLTSTC